MKWLILLFIPLCFINPALSQSKASEDTYSATNISGPWQSNLGRVSFQQRNNVITGTLYYKRGGTARIHGSLAGRQLYFTWRIDGRTYGDGSLTLSGNGHSMSGNYHDIPNNKRDSFNLWR